MAFTLRNCSAPATDDPPNFVTFSIISLISYRSKEYGNALFPERFRAGMHSADGDLLRCEVAISADDRQRFILLGFRRRQIRDRIAVRYDGGDRNDR